MTPGAGGALKWLIFPLEACGAGTNVHMECLAAGHLAGFAA